LYKFFVHVRHPSYRLVISADAPFPAGASDPSVVAVLRPLPFIIDVLAQIRLRQDLAAPDFFCFACRIEFCMRRAFSRKFRYDP
jgi:hypothetical protein